MLELISEFAYCCGLADTIHADNEDDIRFVALGEIPLVKVAGIILLKQRRYLFSQYIVQL